jgi:hypothetical protein
MPIKLKRLLIEQGRKLKKQSVHCKLLLVVSMLKKSEHAS